MSAQILGSELGNIIQEAKKKHGDLRNSAEKTLQELKALPSTSEAQLAGDLRRRPQFVTPLLNACKTGNPKLGLPAVKCLQRLVVSGGLAKERLKDVLDVFQECVKTNHDIQLRILQSLPSFLQNYGDALEGDLHASILQVCTSLQQVKTVAVGGTASATLQQIVLSIFEKVENQDETGNAAVTDIDLDGKRVRIRSVAHDAFRVLDDLCFLTDGKKSNFIRSAVLSPSFGLELIEAILTNHGEIFNLHEEFAHLLRKKVLPLVTRFFTERPSFQVSVRNARILCIILREHLSIVQSEIELPLSLLNHLLDSDGSVAWRRALCMEIFRIVYSTQNLVTDIYNLFDEKEGRRNIVQENLAHFVRLAAEKPALIGVGQQSSFPVGQTAAKPASQEQVVIESGSAAGIISGELGVSEINAPGISLQWSSMKISCLEQPDKIEAPSIPETYVYSLVLTCLNALSDGLAKVVLPLTVQSQSKSESKSEDPMNYEDINPAMENLVGATGEESEQNGTEQHYQRRGRPLPVNPLSLENHTSYRIVKTTAHMVDTCWPAMLATSSTFLYAALDADFYRGLIRSVQKFTQVAGLLRLSTPRDAFFTTLAKSAVPPHFGKTETFLSPTSAVTSPRPGSSSNAFFGGGAQETSLSRTTSFRNSFDAGTPTLSQRNLMCLRALINLAIALGPILEESWSIIIESLQKTDSILAQSGIEGSREYRSGIPNGERQVNDQTGAPTNLSSEIAAVESAVTRLFQSTSEYPNDAFMCVLRALCEVSGSAIESSAPPLPFGSLRIPRRNLSTTSIGSITTPQSRAVHFSIAKLGEVARININRLAADTDLSGWSLLTERLREFAASLNIDNTSRLMAADIVGSISLGITLDTVNDPPQRREAVQIRALASLEQEVVSLYKNLRDYQQQLSPTDLDVHRSALEALLAILEKCGESLISGWRSIFSIINSTFIPVDFSVEETGNESQTDVDESRPTPRPVSTKVARSAFASVQLICSDFLQSLKRSRFVILIDILSNFCLQTADLNVSLTTITLFWNLSDFLQSEINAALDSEDSVPILRGEKHDEELRIAAEQGSVPAMWMILQSRLALIANDERVDVRNGAVQTVYRIIGSIGERLSPQLWQFNLDEVMFKMLEINVEGQAAIRKAGSEKDNQVVKQWNGTTEILLRGLASAFARHLNAISSQPSFGDSWRTLVNHFTSYLELHSNQVATSVFNAILQILAAADRPETFGSTALQETAELWKRGIVVADQDATPDTADRESALVSYVQALKQYYRLISSELATDQVLAFIENLRDCINSSAAVAYTSDIDSPTALQLQVIECIELLNSDLPGVPSAIIKLLAELVKLPYQQTPEMFNKKRLTFVALSKKAAVALQNFIVSHVNFKEIYDEDALPLALSAFSQAVHLKYRFDKQGREPTMWQMATTSSLAILETVLPQMRELQVQPNIVQKIWSEVIRIAACIRGANKDSLPANPILLTDEGFDLQAIIELRKRLGIRLNESDATTVATPRLNDQALDASFPTKYVESVFESSLIHDGGVIPARQDLRSIYTIRSGRTYDPIFNPRIRMCYDCINELFALVATNLNDSVVAGSTGEIAPLAREAFPYLIARCALPLKRYIADQPLRGKMPTPTSQRLELLYILDKCKELNCVVGQEACIADKVSRVDVAVLNPEKRHLELLVPLINKASGHARRDREIADAMQGVLDEAFNARL